MGRTVPSFRIVLAEEKAEWKTFRNALDQSEKKAFDEMWDIARNYVSACSNSVQLVALHPIIISILFHHYKEMKECISEVEQMITEATRTATDKQVLIEVARKKEQRPKRTLDSYFISHEIE